MDDVELEPIDTEGPDDRLGWLAIAVAASTVLTCGFGVLGALLLGRWARPTCSDELRPTLDLAMLGAPMVFLFQLTLGAVWLFVVLPVQLEQNKLPPLLAPPADLTSPPTPTDVEVAASDCAAGKQAYAAGDYEGMVERYGAIWRNTERWPEGRAAKVPGGAEALACGDILKGLVEAEVALRQGADYLASKQYYSADGRWAEAIRLLAPPSLLPDVGAEATKRLNATNRLRAKHAAKVEKDRVRLENESRREAEAAARQAACGPSPLQSQWDGSYSAVERFVEASAHDPDSVEILGCSTARRTDQCWQTTCQYRARNGFGAKMLYTSTFYIASGAVIGVE